MARTLRSKFIRFLLVLVVAAAAAGYFIHELAGDTPRDAAVKGFMLGFDAAAAWFLAASAHLLWIDDPAALRQHAASNDANRNMLLAITVAIAAAVLAAVAMATLGGGGPGPKTRLLIVGTLAITWLFANTIYALHYAHLYAARDGGLEFKGAGPPGYADFLYFAFTLGMTFQTSDVEIADGGIRKVVTGHCLAAFVFNIGVLAFTINVLGG